MSDRIQIPVDYYKVLQENKYIMILEAYIMSDGSNLNNTYFDIESIKEAYPTLANIPILCLWDGWDFKEHARDDYAFSQQKFVGNVPETNHGEIIEYQGKNFQKANILIWKAYVPEVAERLSKNAMSGKETKISVEIDPIEKETLPNGVINIKKFSYCGICLLGQNYKAAIPGAHLDVIKYSDDSEYKEVTDYYNKVYFSLNKEVNIPENVLLEIKELKKNNKNPILLTFLDNINDKKTISNIDMMSLEKYCSDEMRNTKEWCLKMKYSESISIDNSKTSAIISSSWSNPGSSLYDKLIEQPNAKSLLSEAYLIVEDNYKDSPSSALKFPHHKVKGNKLVVDEAGVIAAGSRLNQMKSMGKADLYNKSLAHINKHRKELGLDELGKMSFSEVKSLDKIMAALTDVINEKKGMNTYGLPNAILHALNDKYAIVNENGKMCKYKYTIDEQGKYSIDDTEEPDEDDKEKMSYSAQVYAMLEKMAQEKVEAEKKFAQDKAEMEKKFAESGVEKFAKEVKDLKAENEKLKEEKAKKDNEEKSGKAKEMFSKYNKYLTDEDKEELDKMLFSTDFNTFEGRLYSKVVPKMEGLFSKKNDSGFDFSFVPKVQKEENQNSNPHLETLSKI